jgi:hypothetical protein
VIVVPLDTNLRAVGQPFVAVSSGMSVGGMRLIHTRPCPSDFLLLEIECQPVKLLLAVLRSCPVGGCFEIAGRFMKADVAERQKGSPALLTTDCRAVTGADGRAGQGDSFPPTVDELVQWAGLTAAVQILNPELNHNSRRA